MTKNILIIGGRTTDLGETELMDGYARYFVKGLDEVKQAFVHFDELSFCIAPKSLSIYDHRNGRSLDDYDLIVFRGKIRANSELAYCISRFCDRSGIAFFNDYTPYRPASKVSQAVTFFELDVRFTKTVYAMDRAILRQTIERELRLPFILKDSYGAHGNNNYLIKSYDQLSSILNDYPEIKFIAQDFFPNNCDYRILCIGARSFIIRRTAAGDSHLNNTSQGGSADIVSEDFFPADVLVEAHRIADELKMGIAGVDLLFDEISKNYAFLEVNSQPQLNSGAFPEEKQLVVRDYIRQLLED